jgi:hypothetical protein
VISAEEKQLDHYKREREAMQQHLLLSGQREQEDQHRVQQQREQYQRYEDELQLERQQWLVGQ